MADLPRDERGSVVVTVAIMIAVLLGVAALAVDTGYAYSVKTRLSATADAAALAAVSELPDATAAQATALEYVEKNMPAAQNGTVLAAADIATGYWDKATRTFASGVTPLNAVRVTARRSSDNGNALGLLFARVMGFAETDISVTSLAGRSQDAVCLLALGANHVGAVYVGNAEITTTDCSVRVNSDDALALDGNSNGVLTASSICVGGNYGSQPTYSPAPQTACAPMPDPLTNLQMPVVGTCDYTNATYNGGTVTIDPGVYCGGISVGSSTVLTLNPGIYIIKDGVLKVAGGSSIQGDGVAFYLTGATASIDIAGGGTVNLSPPISGTLAGILFTRNPSDYGGQTDSFGGGASVQYAGIIYLPKGNIIFNGNSESTVLVSAAYIIAHSFSMNGGGSLTLSNDYAAANFPIPCELSGTCATLLR